MRYFVFIDESGEANITNPDPRFDIFVLCGIVFEEPSYLTFDNEFKKLKKKYFSNEDIVFHSIKMRKKEGGFKIFLDANVQQEFYNDIGLIFKKSNYIVLSCIVDKQKYKNRYPDKNYAYEDALTFLCERAIKIVGNQEKENVLHFCLEKRGNRKDSQLKKLYTNIRNYGTNYTSTNAFKVCHPTLFFRGKDQNINGLQFADLCAYPIARKTLSPGNPQLTYDLFENKIYSNWLGVKRGYGLKYFP
jgi:hypothetical protein